uniref:Secreted protein n=1 Tax=Panstrongylus lignarius TaxID=156445 RepID=A0A224Y2F5_9HEMI
MAVFCSFILFITNFTFCPGILSKESLFNKRCFESLSCEFSLASLNNSSFSEVSFSSVVFMFSIDFNLEFKSDSLLNFLLLGAFTPLLILCGLNSTSIRFKPLYCLFLSFC